MQHPGCPVVASSSRDLAPPLPLDLADDRGWGPCRQSQHGPPCTQADHGAVASLHRMVINYCCTQAQLTCLQALGWERPILGGQVLMPHPAASKPRPRSPWRAKRTKAERAAKATRLPRLPSLQAWQGQSSLSPPSTPAARQVLAWLDSHLIYKFSMSTSLSPQSPLNCTWLAALWLDDDMHRGMCRGIGAHCRLITVAWAQHSLAMLCNVTAPIDLGLVVLGLGTCFG
ncbi:hypothetical protein V8C86DRAFT_2517369 [Haematococcus lacustris]